MSSASEVTGALALYAIESIGSDGFDTAMLEKRVRKLISFGKGGEEEGDLVMPAVDALKKYIKAGASLSFHDLEKDEESGDVTNASRHLKNLGYSFCKRVVLDSKVHFWLERGSLKVRVIRRYASTKGPLFDKTIQPRLAVVNLEGTRWTHGRRSQLNFLRCQLVAEALQRVSDRVCQQDDGEVKKVAVGCSDKRELEKKCPGAVGCSVGAVADAKTGKRDDCSSVADVYKDVFSSCVSVAKEKEEENGEASDEEKLQARIRRLASSCIRLQLLSKSTSRPCPVPSSADDDATFILYNYARIVHVVLAHGEEGSGYPPLPDLEDNAGMTAALEALTHELEWGLVLNGLFQFGDVVRAVVEDHDRGVFHLQKLHTFLLLLSRDFSRYYRSVRVLLNPLPHLIPIVAGRVILLKALKRLYEEAFLLLGITPPKNM